VGDQPLGEGKGGAEDGRAAGEPRGQGDGEPRPPADLANLAAAGWGRGAAAADGDAVDPRVGATYGKYRILRRLGRGGMGVVYMGEDTVLKRGVAIKFLPDDLNNKTEVVERFIREAQVAGRLSHPNIIAIHDVAMDKHGCYMVMELLDPHNARSRLSKGPYPWQVATRIIADCCEALKVAHDAGIIHRDCFQKHMVGLQSGAKPRHRRRPSHADLHRLYCPL
jgi:serine/threonine protein kinase